MRKVGREVSDAVEANELHAEFVAAPDAPSAARRLLQAFLRRIGWSPVGAEDLTLAVSEAVSNAAQHAYPNTHPGPITLRAHVATDRHRDRRVRVIVTDRGRWRTELPVRSRFGVPIMEVITAQLDIDTGAVGTRVAMVSHSDAGPGNDQLAG
jgi:anti-sigma regulatory factor (Ser/Thr protein kinase)